MPVMVQVGAAATKVSLDFSSPPPLHFIEMPTFSYCSYPYPHVCSSSLCAYNFTNSLHAHEMNATVLLYGMVMNDSALCFLVSLMNYDDEFTYEVANDARNAAKVSGGCNFSELPPGYVTMLKPLVHIEEVFV